METLNENPSLQITIVKIDGSNYLCWSCSCLSPIESRGLSNYLKGEYEELKMNPLVMSWLFHSMLRLFAFCYLLTPHVLFKQQQTGLSRSVNDVQVYELRENVHKLNRRA